MTLESSVSDRQPTSPLLDEAAAIVEEITKVQQPIIERLNALLAGLEGLQFSIEQVVLHNQEIESLRYAIKLAGCELFYGVDMVQIRLINQKNAKNLKVSLRSKSAKGQKVLYANMHFPKLQVRPVSQ